MLKRVLENIATVPGAIRLVAVSTVYYMAHNTAGTSIEPSREMQPYFFYSAADTQLLAPLDPEQDNSPSETAQSPLWNGILFPIDDDGQELGRKIGDWVVKKIKNK
jgi:hypothetical protein